MLMSFLVEPLHKHSYLFNDRTALSLEPLVHDLCVQGYPVHTFTHGLESDYPFSGQEFT